MKYSINQFTARALASNVFKEVKKSLELADKSKLDTAKKSPLFKKFLALRKEIQQREDAKKALAAEIEKTFAVRIYGEDLKLTSVSEVDSRAIENDLIIAVNVNGRTPDQATKEVAVKHSKK